MSKRVLAMLLTLMMIISIVPVSASAAEYHGRHFQKPVFNKPDYHKHTYVGEVTKLPEGRQNGVITYTCTGCGETYTKSFSGWGHHFVKSVKEATCEEDGLITWTCKKRGCGLTYTEVISASGHAWEEAVEEATCTENGRKYSVCANCGAESAFAAVIPAVDHNFVANGQQIIEPTCTEDGYILTRYICMNDCGESTEKISPLGEAAGHNWEKKIDEATCTEAGREYSVCTACGAESALSAVIPATGHDYTVEVAPKAATCTEDGYEYSVCGNCGEESPFQAVIPAYGHTYGENGACECGAIDPETPVEAVCEHPDEKLTKDYQEATCTEGGHSVVTCECGVIVHEEKWDAKGHTYGENGACACGAIDPETPVEAVCEHPDEKLTKDYQEATCTEGGHSVVTCECGVIVHEEKWDAKGHTYGENGACACGAIDPETPTEEIECQHPDAMLKDKSVAPTCTEEGRKHVVCTACDEILADEVIPADGHAWLDGKCVTCGKTSPFVTAPDDQEDAENEEKDPAADNAPTIEKDPAVEEESKDDAEEDPKSPFFHRPFFGFHAWG